MLRDCIRRAIIGGLLGLSVGIMIAAVMIVIRFVILALA